MSTDKVDELRAEIDALKDRMASIEEKLDSEPEIVEDATTLRSFIAKAEPTTHAEKALFIAYYFEKYEREDAFTSRDIDEGYEDARLHKPANMSDVLGDCEDKGWMMRAGKRGQSDLRRLTQQGFAHVEEVLNDESR